MTGVVTQLDWASAPRYDHEGCPFCDIVHGRAPAEIVHTWPEAIAIEPLNPVAFGHVIVIPMTHVRDLTEDPVISASITQRVVEIAHDMMMDYGRGVERGDVGVNVITSIGSLATQSVFHLHVHVVPRREDDGLMLPWSHES